MGSQTQGWDFWILGQKRFRRSFQKKEWEKELFHPEMLKGRKAYARCDLEMDYGRHKTFKLQQAKERDAKVASKSKRGKTGR